MLVSSDRSTCLPAAVTLTSELLFSFHSPHHTRPLIPHYSLKIFCFIVTPISTLISTSMWMILQISFSAIPVDLIFPLISATPVLVILSTLWLPVKLPRQVSIQALSDTPLRTPPTSLQPTSSTTDSNCLSY
ncbi:unnamed protein product [Rangifer tarandus platyrhynchus]|uniref:Uncharacterized protein n=2 Tax=Rangifer tarandus platyrhynchus TaxID=3082113 RepID=A0ABN8YG65_RANTA|nr:unnamed protein product [Rangifer tarandus platyrhynchus]